MCQHRALGSHESCSPRARGFLSTSLRTLPRHLTVAKHQGRRFLIAKFLGIGAVCLAAVLTAGIALEAFDDDLDLWPFGAEDCTVAPHGQPVTDGQTVGPPVGLPAGHCFVNAAGAHLVLRHRARSALAANRPFNFPPFSMAEPRELSPTPALGLGHFFF
jgi:hypothetical protein